MPLIEIPEWAKTDQELWTPSLVLNAHAFAERVFRALPGHVGPKGPSTAWPIMAPDPEDDVELEEEEYLRPSRLDITRAEWVITGFRGRDGREHPGWRNGALLGYPKQRRLFLRWSRWASFGKRSVDGRPETEEDFAERLRMSYATMRRQKEFSASIVARTLNDALLPVWHHEKPPRRNNRHAAGSR